MAHQSPEDKADRQSGTHDVTKSDQVMTPHVTETVEDLLNQHAPSGIWDNDVYGTDPYNN